MVRWSQSWLRIKEWWGRGGDLHLAMMLIEIVELFGEKQPSKSLPLNFLELFCKARFLDQTRRTRLSLLSVFQKVALQTKRDLFVLDWTIGKERFFAHQA